MILNLTSPLQVLFDVRMQETMTSHGLLKNAMIAILMDEHRVCVYLVNITRVLYYAHEECRSDALQG